MVKKCTVNSFLTVMVLLVGIVKSTQCNVGFKTPAKTYYHMQ